MQSESDQEHDNDNGRVRARVVLMHGVRVLCVLMYGMSLAYIDWFKSMRHVFSCATFIRFDSVRRVRRLSLTASRACVVFCLVLPL